ncbi:MAG: hypothetical protein C0176_02040 [Mesoaciditoga sp.]|uniref:hypothetical protein n=1 Tax=Athalassotoga sp. TaxID=2022597 RepID=UPI000CAFB16D|nr:MAG: hypothetical protein C0185_02630 [Mesoaciditoga sp.]PMP80448.1 MAG: hypothetical protein C0176_02040 [Mesoaciditoga sp.]HEU23536.1 hypothetical protein [Mesoaciditoga lauensis]
MPEIRIDQSKFKRFVRIFDRVSGTIEPSMRRVYFYTNLSTLMAYGTDGCLSVDLEIAPIEPFDGFYTVPLDDLKLLLREKSEEVRMNFGSNLQISSGTEIISILHPLVSNPRKSDHIETQDKIYTSQFKKVLDLGSIISREGQMIFIGTGFGKFLCASEDYGHTGIGFMEFKGDPFSAEIPYESVRHLVKTLDAIREDKIEIGYSSKIGIRFSDGIMSICSTPSDTGKINEFLNFDVSDFEVPVKALKEGSTLAARFQRRNGGRGYLELSDMIKFIVISAISAYEYNYPIEWGKTLKVAISPMKFQRFFSRLNEKYVNVGLNHEYLVFKGLQSLLIVKIEK